MAAGNSKKHLARAGLDSFALLWVISPMESGERKYGREPSGILAVTSMMEAASWALIVSTDRRYDSAMDTWIGYHSEHVVCIVPMLGLGTVKA